MCVPEGTFTPYILEHPTVGIAEEGLIDVGRSSSDDVLITAEVWIGFDVLSSDGSSITEEALVDIAVSSEDSGASFTILEEENVGIGL